MPASEGAAACPKRYLSTADCGVACYRSAYWTSRCQRVVSYAIPVPVVPYQYRSSIRELSTAHRKRQISSIH
eukprot:3939756-Rhodomonas_salina.1